jgi:uncharacterized protein
MGNSQVIGLPLIRGGHRCDFQIPDSLFFSRFAHRLEQNGMHAYYHALRLQSVYLASNMAELIERIRFCPDTGVLLQSIADKSLQDQTPDAINALLANKVLVKNSEADAKVISHFRSAIPSPYIQIAYFFLTENCNFDCSYCFVKRDAKMRPGTAIMSPETAIKGLDFFCRQIAKEPKRFSDEKSLIFYGGEPLLNATALRVVAERINKYKAEGKLPDQTHASIVTNGALLSQENIDLLKSNNIDISICLDGDERATNSCRRRATGDPVYDDIINGINRCKESGAPFGLSVTLTEQSVKDFDKTMEELLAIGHTGLGFNTLLTDTSFKVADWYNEAAADCVIRGFEIFRRLGIYEDRMMRKVRSFAESRVHVFDCGAAGGGQIVIAPDGQIGICHGLIGSRECFPTNVDDMDFDPASDLTFLEWGRRTPLNMEECQGCMALGICGGGCPLNALKNEGSIWGMDERFCVHSKKTMSWLVWDLFQKMREKGPESITNSSPRRAE